MYKIEFLDIEENDEFEKTISKVLEECFKVENLPEDKLLVSITLTNPENKSPVYNAKRREEKKIEKKFDCTQRAVLIWMKIWNV